MKQLISSFTCYEFTHEEMQRGPILDNIQKAIIQNKIANAAERKLALQFTPNDILAYTQQEASLAGEIAALRGMIFDSEEAERNLKSSGQ
jgi:uncharacterized protein involved in exopolysaccharide biosynthesis